MVGSVVLVSANIIFSRPWPWSFDHWVSLFIYAIYAFGLGKGQEKGQERVEKGKG